MLRKNLVAAFVSACLCFHGYSQPPKNYSSSDILLQLKKLHTVGTVLYIAAHPDDENTRLIAYLANEKCVRTGYLSLTRGDGGQNLIGPEQGVELGLIRTQELLAARRIDGGEQFFTRAYDFGYSKTPQETFSKWEHDSILRDVVWVIRSFRPDIIITRFSTDGSGGHGHHTASAILAGEAFDAAADPTRFPEQLRYVTPWKAQRLFYNSAARFFNPNADLSGLVRLDVGVYNPLLGKSYGEIAAESRSMHRSQGFGSARQRGEAFEYFKAIKGDTTGLMDIFQRISLEWPKPHAAFDKELVSIINSFDIRSPVKSAARLKKLQEKFGAGLPPYHASLLNEIRLACEGTFADAVTRAATYSVGTNIPVNTGRVLRYEKSCPDCEPQPLQHDIKDSTIFLATQITEPYWMKHPIFHDRFQADSIQLLNAPESKTLMRLTDGDISISRPLQYKWVDPSRGELYRPTVATPPVMINLPADLMVFAGSAPKEIKVILRAGKDGAKGSLRAACPAGWRLHAKDSANNAAGVPFSLAKKGEEHEFVFIVDPPAAAASDVLRFSVETEGEVYSKGIREIRYDHIPVQTWFPEAEAKLVRIELSRKLRRIGYIPGAGDEVAQCLAQLGYEVTTITDEMLVTGDLAFDAIVTGVRAYNINEKLSVYRYRLMDYVAAGGNLVVQYNTNSFAGPIKGEIGPFPFKLSRDRVTDENAVVTFALPSHPLLNTPNRITAKDFEGWIQERCIYSAIDSSGRYEMPLSMADPGEKPNTGSLLVAKHGKGHFIYTGLVLFRELPAGVPGAYRLFVNMLELGKE